jgi:carbamoyl-phosphate synthase large subunit
MKEICVIMTGAGAPGARGTEYAMREGARRQGVRLRIVGIDRNPNVAARGFCDAIRVVPSPLSPNYASELAVICRDEGAQIVVPQTTAEIEWLSAHGTELADVKVLVNSRYSIDLANNKIATVRVFAELGLGVPQMFETNTSEEFTEACHDLGYPDVPVVVKMPISNGMRGLRILRREPWTFERFVAEKPDGTECTFEQMLQILEAAPEWPVLMVSEYLDGDEYSVDCYRGRSGAIALPRRRDVIRTGISFATTLERREDMIRASLTAGERMGLHGVFGFQYKLRLDGYPMILECNPRVQGTMIASLATGNNIIWAAVTDLLPDQLESVSMNLDWEGGRCLRYWGALVEDGSGELILV